ncbi:Alpha/beta hydrolase family protein [Nonomuraea coxensis DSM 45129]|uniref:Alpha/beta hydrolase family protein n=1 Tax=Nonomuraea coxensis DSM 45129 TaxID=1122611 RepID=A0ABX8U3Q9_9ACTN|nr:alpha/beta hydrolase [Nonomuraea coxensis]QYC42304.1 Alpha/beta hydrolase family protein [Nonomuraea coxensis DSM 45129]
MTTFALIHGGGGSAFDWHLVEAELRDRGHDTVAVDLPMSDPRSGLWDYADAVVRAAGGRRPLVVVAHSWGGFVAPLVCARAPAAALVLVTAMIPAPGEPPDDWWERSGRPPSGIDDEHELYFHDVPRDLARRVADHDGALAATVSVDRAGREPWPLPAWPDVPTRYLLCRDDRFFTPGFVRRHVGERLGITPDEMPGGHMVMLSRPAELAAYLAGVLPAAP